jgi:AcrR family transcriptional regulator
MARVSADVRRDLLVEAAIRVMVRDGVAKTTTRAIVAEADMALGAFHYCFRSKAELLESVIEGIQAHTVDLALAAFEEGGTLEERLLRGIRIYWQHVLDNPDEHQVTYELAQFALRSPELADVARKQYEHYIASITQIMETLSEATGVSWSQPLPVLARYMISVIDGLTLIYLTEGDGDSTLAALELAVRHVATLAGPHGQIG